MIKIKTLLEIYKELKESFYKKTNIDIGRGTIIDMLFSAIADQFSMIYQTIEDNKKPYLFTKQYGDELDSTGYFVSLPRIEGESDENYKYRIMNWNLRHASCNSTAIDDKCKELKFSTAANYVQYTKGVGTATITATAGVGVEAACAVTVSAPTILTCAQAAEKALSTYVALSLNNPKLYANSK